MKVYIDIVLSGKNFNPNEVATLCGLSFSKAINKGEYNPYSRMIETVGMEVAKEIQKEVFDDYWR